MEGRMEKDFLGEVWVPKNSYYAAQTQRALNHFKIGEQKFPAAIILAFGQVKKAAAITNHSLGILPLAKYDLIVQACDEVIDGKLDQEFPLVIWQSGSGTQSHMYINEVIANRAIEICGGRRGTKHPIHPNDDVNLSQSSNDVFPTVMHLAALDQLSSKLMPALQLLREDISDKVTAFTYLTKIGRTHLMDATPLTLGQILNINVRDAQCGYQYE